MGDYKIDEDILRIYKKAVFWDGEEMKTLEYKWYEGTIECCEESNCYHGKIMDTDHLVTYEGDTLEELEKAFQESCEDLWELEHKLAIEAEQAYEQAVWENDQRVLRHVKKTSPPKIYKWIDAEVNYAGHAAEFEIVDVSCVTGERLSGKDYFGESTPIKKVYTDGGWDYWGEDWSGYVYLWIGKGKYFKMFVVE